MLAPSNGLPGANLLELTVAARHDRYRIHTSDFAYTGAFETPPPAKNTDTTLSSTNPTFTLRFQPVSDITLRGSYGTGFAPPDVGVFAPSPDAQADGSVRGGITDPRRGNQPIGQFTVHGGGNPNLKPERSKSWAAGFILTPRVLPDLRLSVDWSRIDKRDNISYFQVNSAASTTSC